MEKHAFCSKCGCTMISFPQIKQGKVRWTVFSENTINVSGFDKDTGETLLLELWACEKNSKDSTMLGYRNRDHDYVEVLRTPLKEP